ncbi:alpha/beta hydrolase-fold protein [Fictibacillus sp. NPDC058756]|uniref:alpha/beta hydrolase-fold protein n=1 Tax=Fictibacillus sp. NPDC058756 TaxID=3346625 RepID=UPI0036AB1B47
MVLNQEKTQSPFVSNFLANMENKEQALKDFLNDIRLRGTPIIEICPNNQVFKLVTFIWIGDSATTNVHVFGSFPGWDISNSRLTNIKGTEIWYKTYRTNETFVSTYRFSINDQFKEDWVKRSKNYQNDPFNKNTFLYVKNSVDPESKDSLTSILELGMTLDNNDTQTQDYSKGNLEIHDFTSAILNNERRIWIYTPSNYLDKETPCKLLISYDGRPTMTTLKAPTILDKLIHNKEIPPVVMIGINSVNRFQELTFNHDFIKFLSNELVPWVRNKYNVSKDPKDNIISGFSLGGLASFFAAFNHPEIFGNVLSLSGSVHWKKEGYEGEIPWMLQSFKDNKTLPIKVFMEAGILENKPLLDSNKNLHKILKSKGYDVQYNEFLGGHDDIWWQNELPQGLKYLLNN